MLFFFYIYKYVDVCFCFFLLDGEIRLSEFGFFWNRKTYWFKGTKYYYWYTFLFGHSLQIGINEVIELSAIRKSFGNPNQFISAK